MMPRSASTSPREPRRRAGRALALQRGAADEIAILRLPGNGPGQVLRQRGGLLHPCPVRTDSGRLPDAAYRGHRDRRAECPQRPAAHPRADASCWPQTRISQPSSPGIARAADEPAVRCTAWNGCSASAAGHAMPAAATARPSARAAGPCTASIARSSRGLQVARRSPGHARAARQVLVAGGGIDHQPVVVPPQVTAIGDQVIDHTALLIQHAAVQSLAGRRAWPHRWPAAGAGSPVAPAPLTSTTVMCETSKTPADVRTA